jgi:hypothetical protein
MHQEAGRSCPAAGRRTLGDFEAGTAAGAYRHHAASRVYDTSATVSECGHSCTD